MLMVVPSRALSFSIIVCILLVWWQCMTSLDTVVGPSHLDLGGDVQSLVRTRQSTDHRKFFHPVPEKSRKLFWVRKSIHAKLYEPVVRAFHSRGYSLTENPKRAHLLWSDHPFSSLYQELKPWQRYSWIPDIDQWDDKDSMAYNLNNYFAQKGETPHFSFPETYLLHDKTEFKRFQKRLRDGGINDPWVLKEPTVNQGKGVVIAGPHSKPLLNIMNSDRSKKKHRRVAQKYICDEMTYFGRKFDFRIFWLVASVDPLVVLYQTKHNYVRVGAAAYDETDFSKTQSHLTTHTFGANEIKATWDEFKVYIEEFHALQGDRLSHIKYPFQHLENQSKHVIALLADAFKHMTYTTRGISSQNAFTWHSADMIVDNDLDVYIIEGADGPGKDEDYDFRIEMHNTMFGDMIDIVEEVVRLQEQGHSIDVRVMQENGVLGSYEVVYNDGWMFNYSFDRSAKKGCSVSVSSDGSKNTTVNVPDEFVKVVIEKASLTALPKKSIDEPVKTFYMEGRTSQNGEPIARSLRSKGWTPVDDYYSAQLVYETEVPKKFPDDLQPWQIFNHVPKERKTLSMVQSKKDETQACDPMLFNGRKFSVKVFFLIASQDPLIVFYHDGYLDIPYDEKDENEFVYPKQNKLSSPNGLHPVWRGSWTSFEGLLRQTSIDSPMLHVKGQMKTHLINAAKHFKKRKQKTVSPEMARSFGIYKASFNLDRNLHVMKPIVHEMYIYSEGYQEIVDLHNDVFGSAFDLIEAYNSTSSDFLTVLDSARGGYELILDDETGEKFQYSYEGRPSPC
ncbi:tubulin-tyrosine ligase family protein [Nitzschia inconspicua]|uniref:Tubulin-tyrosine ligase family protein n=1 Tax=Nitzschia inconspicua TaxID=303405 RepID=A0A9K3L948_9STRA|nr:tubulin-tyrosine ligase family protein [Nitzschia inconspicua]